MEGFPPFGPNWFSVRLTVAFSQLNLAFLGGLKALCVGIVGVEHADGSQPHLHLGIVNARLSHDPFRKALVKLVREHLATDATGNSLLSVKKWDGQQKYVVYMIKGKYPLMFNEDNTGKELISSEYYERLKRMWISKTVVENDYVSFKNSTYYPTPRLPPTDDQLVLMMLWNQKEHKQYNDDRCDVIWQACVSYARSFTNQYIDSKGKYLAKNLYSNYCLFNKLKPKVQYI